MCGGGFGGVKVALELAGSSGLSVTLVSDQDDFHYHASLYHSATGGSRAQSVISLKDIFAAKVVKIIKDSVQGIDRGQKTIKTSGSGSIPYDSLVMALGNVTNYFGIKGLAEYSFGINTYGDAIRLKRHLHDQLITSHHPDINYIVVGAGPTGVELAGVLPGYIKQILKRHGIKRRTVNILLIESAAQVLPSMPKDLSRSVARRLRRLGVRLLLGKKVIGESVDDLMVEGRPIKSQTVAWTAGLTNHPFFSANNFTLSDNGKVKVNEYLEAEPDIFVVGDNADTPYSGMAQTAIRDADLAARNIKLRAAGKPLQTYKPRKPVYVTPVGPHWAAVLWGKWRICGRLGWFVRRTADWLGYHEVETWWKASKQMVASNDNEENCPECAVNDIR